MQTHSRIDKQRERERERERDISRQTHKPMRIICTAYAEHFRVQTHMHWLHMTVVPIRKPASQTDAAHCHGVWSLHGISRARMRHISALHANPPYKHA